MKTALTRGSRDEAEGGATTIPKGAVATGLFSRAFTLLEVMIALAIFFMAVFAILGAVSQGLSAARSLQVVVPDVGMVVADLMLTNRLEEDFQEGDFGDLYPGFTWSREIVEAATNGLYQVNITIRGPGAVRGYQSDTSLYLWRPDSQRRLPGLAR